jgi:nanoRNase/pAp phosphatase (c-di-AMP/oligoRNAs hydrolase)
MQSSPNEQFKSILAKTKNALILTPSDFDEDILSASYAISLFLSQKEIQSTIILDDKYDTKSHLSFLPTPKKVEDRLSQARDFILAFNTSKNKIANVRTEKGDEELKIFITPEKGAIRPQDFSFIPAKFKYDLVIVLGSPNKESLGRVFEENPDIFYEVPVVNIDNHSDNEEFGKINIINVVSSSICEIVTQTLEENNEKFTQEISECLLTGIIETTESFQNKKTTPKSLQISAKLMEYGANQQEIIRHLYKTQPLHILKLWGRVMAKLQWNNEIKLIWSLISVEDFVQSRSKPKDARFILKKIQENYSSGKIFMLLYNETPESFKGIIKTTTKKDLEKISKNIQGKLEGNIFEFKATSADLKTLEEKITKSVSE